MNDEQLTALMANHWPEHALNDAGAPHERFDMHAILRMCGCGLPDEVAAWLLGHMRLLSGESRFLAQTPADWFLAYELDARGWTEHGSSLSGGGWLTDKGKAALAVLDYFAREVLRDDFEEV